jgi:hypothetical protein
LKRVIGVGLGTGYIDLHTFGLFCFVSYVSAFQLSPPTLNNTERYHHECDQAVEGSASVGVAVSLLRGRRAPYYTKAQNKNRTRTRRGANFNISVSKWPLMWEKHTSGNCKKRSNNRTPLSQGDEMSYPILGLLDGRDERVRREVTLVLQLLQHGTCILLVAHADRMERECLKKRDLSTSLINTIRDRKMESTLYASSGGLMPSACIVRSSETARV